MNIGALSVGAIAGFAGSRLLTPLNRPKPTTSPIIKILPAFSGGAYLGSSAAFPRPLDSGYKTLFASVTVDDALPHADAVAVHTLTSLLKLTVTHSVTGASADIFNLNAIYDVDGFVLTPSQGVFKDGVFVDVINDVTAGVIISATLPYSFDNVEIRCDTVADVAETPTSFAWVQKIALVEGQFQTADFAVLTPRVTHLWSGTEFVSTTDVPAT